MPTTPHHTVNNQYPISRHCLLVKCNYSFTATLDYNSKSRKVITKRFLKILFRYDCPDLGPWASQEN